MITKYRPSNGTEGESFMEDFCYRCAKDSERKPCAILGRALCFGENDPDYPTEWIEEGGEAKCTAFVDRKSVEKGERNPMQRKPLKGQMVLFTDE